ncbi:cyclic nucleotide-binding domain-containing protein [Candidatus Riflebacteria bacterium]
MGENFFEGLSAEEKEKIKGLARELTYSQDDIVYEMGDPGVSFYLVLKGEISLSKIEGGKEALLETSRDGEFFGEVEAIQGKNRLCQAKCNTDCTLWEVTKSNLDMLLKVNPFISLKIMKNLSAKFRAQSAPVGATEEEKIAEPVDEGRVITFFSPCNRVGQSTLALNIGGCLSGMLKKKVCLLDLDLQFGDIKFLLFPDKAPKSRTLGELVQEEPIDEDILKSYLVKHEPSGMDIILAPAHTEHSELVDVSAISNIISILKKNYDYILVDTHSILNDVNITLFNLTKILFLIIIPDKMNFRHLHRSCSLLDKVFSEGVKERVRILVNRVGEFQHQDNTDIEKQSPIIPSYYVPHAPHIFHLTANESQIFSTIESSEGSVVALKKIACGIEKVDPEKYLKVSFVTKIKNLFW